MNFLQTFQINAPTVVSEIFDDEVVIINMDSGSYYSLDQSGATIWKSLQQSVNLAEIIASVAASYAVNPEEIEHAVQQFIKELAQEQLITTDNAAALPLSTQVFPVVAVYAAGNQGCFSPPALNKYTDMQDLLLLDPIHDVDDTGWPKRKTA